MLPSDQLQGCTDCHCCVTFLSWQAETAWRFKLTNRSKVLALTLFEVRFTDFLVHKSLFTWGFWLAAAENTSTIARQQNNNAWNARLAEQKSSNTLSPRDSTEPWRWNEVSAHNLRPRSRQSNTHRSITRGNKAGTIPLVRITMGAPNHCGGAPKGPKNITGTFFNTVQLLSKYLRFDHGGPNVLFAPGAI